MAGTTIASATTVGVRITLASQLPLLVTSAGAINAAAGDGVYLAAGLAGVFANLGTVAAKSAAGIAAQAMGAALIVNGASAAGGPTLAAALLAGGAAGVSVGGAATLDNYATITATNSAAAPGFASVGAYLHHGGGVNNGAAASITGASVGVAVFGAAASLANLGRIAGTGAAGRGVWLAGGGSVTNGGSANTTAAITGAGQDAVYAAAMTTVTNFATISGGRSGLDLRGGGGVVNGSLSDSKATIGGARYGVYIGAFDGGSGPFSVTNDGTISGTNSSGVAIYGAGAVSNGAAGDTTARIAGRNGVYLRGAGSVTNFGTIAATVEAAIALFAGGAVSNGNATSTAALITASKGVGVYATGASASVLNFGHIVAARDAVVLQSGGTLANGASGVISASDGNGFYADGLATLTNAGTIGDTSSKHSAVVLFAGGTITNGGTANATALISAQHTAIYAKYDMISVTNFGRITTSQGSGIFLDNGGSVVNGGGGDTAAAITGASNGIGGYGLLSISNFATVSSTGTNSAIYLGGSGTLINGSATDTTALITAPRGGVYAAKAASITNFATISATGTAAWGAIGFGAAGGTVVNGSTADTQALLSGGTPVGSYGALSVTNFGTLQSSGTVNTGSAIWTNTGASALIVNGSAADTKALMASTWGLDLGGGGTVINSGTISAHSVAVDFTGAAGGTVVNAGTIENVAGASATAIAFAGGPGRLVDDPGSTIIGTVNGGSAGSVLELAAGAAAGSIAGIGSTFFGFQTLQVDAGASWTASGSNSIATLADSGTLTVASSLSITGPVSPLAGGTIDIAGGATLAVESVLGSGPAIAFLGAAELVAQAPGTFGLHVGTPQYSGPLLEHFAAGDTVDLVGTAPAMAGATLLASYTAATGLLDITSSTAGAPPLASLLFQTSSLGAGGFHLASDGHGGELLTHS